MTPSVPSSNLTNAVSRDAIGSGNGLCCVSLFQEPYDFSNLLIRKFGEFVLLAAFYRLRMFAKSSIITASHQSHSRRVLHVVRVGAILKIVNSVVSFDPVLMVNRHIMLPSSQERGCDQGMNGGCQLPAVNAKRNHRVALLVKSGTHNMGLAKSSLTNESTSYATERAGLIRLPLWNRLPLFISKLWGGKLQFCYSRFFSPFTSVVISVGLIARAGVSLSGTTTRATYRRHVSTLDFKGRALKRVSAVSTCNLNKFYGTMIVTHDVNLRDRFAKWSEPLERVRVPAACSF